MSLNAKHAPGGGGSNIPPMEAGTYPARLVQVIALGLHPQSYAGETKPPAHEIALTWEFVDEFLTNEDGEPDESKPRHLTETMAFYNLSSEKAKSTLRYLALDPTLAHDGDWEALLETPANVMVVQNPKKGDPTKVYNNIRSVTAMRPRDAAKMPQLVNKPVSFDLEDPDPEVFTSLPKFIQDKIKNNLEYNGSKLQTLLKEPATATKPAARNKPVDLEEELDGDEIPY